LQSRLASTTAQECVPEEASYLPALEELKNLLDNFICVHGPLFNHAALCAIDMQGGTRNFDITRYCLVFNLYYNRRCGGNPATSFLVDNASFVLLDDLLASSLYSTHLNATKPSRDRMLTVATGGKDEENIAQLLLCYEADIWMLFGSMIVSRLSFPIAGLQRAEMNRTWLETLQEMTWRGHVLFKEIGSDDIKIGTMKKFRSKWRLIPMTTEDLRSFKYTPCLK
jgi:hypothetical protein